MDAGPIESRTECKRRVSRENFSRLLERSQWTVEELAARTGVPAHTLRRWLRVGIAQPKHDHILAVAGVFGLADPWSLINEPIRSTRLPGAINRSTNPIVEELRADRPELFAEFTAEDWDELYAHFGTGGPLTDAGAAHFAERITQKRKLQRKVEILLETEHFGLLQQLVEVLYRDTEVR